jgi:hypothetical protein
MRRAPRSAIALATFGLCLASAIVMSIVIVETLNRVVGR